MTPRARTPLLAGLAAAICAIAVLALLAGRKDKSATVAGERMDAAAEAPAASPETPRPSLAATGRAAAAVELAGAADTANSAAASEPTFDPAALYGLVTGLDRQPVEGAELHVWPAGGQGPALASIASDAAGLFRFTELEPQSSYALLCAAEGYLPVQALELTGRHVAIELEPAAPFAGVVLDEATRLPHERAPAEGPRAEALRGPERHDQPAFPRVVRRRQGHPGQDRRREGAHDQELRLLRHLRDRRPELRGLHLRPRRHQGLRVRS